MELRTVHSYSYLYILYCMCLLIPMIFILQHRRIVMLVYKQVTKFRNFFQYFFDAFSRYLATLFTYI